MAAPQFTVCALFYGDYPDLCQRLMQSLARPAWRAQIELRVGCNECSAATADVLRTYTGGLLAPERTWWSSTNMLKYPLMRRMFYDQAITTPYVMWLDDDSWIQPYAPDATFDLLASYMETAVGHEERKPDMLGVLWQIRLRGMQHLWIRDQPWFSGKPVAAGQQVNFATGGWWVIRSEILRRWDWPTPELAHNGGDVMLGELCRQQGYFLRNYPHHGHFAVNADRSGRCSTAVRRGESQNPVGCDYQPRQP